MMQEFECYVPADQKHWKRLEKWGIDSIWIPPGCKGSSPTSNGYDIYDLYDLGEFAQKGSTPTKCGSKADLTSLCNVARDQDVGIYCIAVLNHRFGADRIETCRACAVGANDRVHFVSDPHDVDAWWFKPLAYTLILPRYWLPMRVGRRFVRQPAGTDEPRVEFLLDTINQPL